MIERETNVLLLGSQCSFGFSPGSRSFSNTPAWQARSPARGAQSPSWPCCLQGMKLTAKLPVSLPPRLSNMVRGIDHMTPCRTPFALEAPVVTLSTYQL